MKKWMFIFFFFTRLNVFSQNEKAAFPSLFRGDARHIGVYSGKGFKKFGDIKWTFTTKGKIFSSPALFNGMVYLGSEDSGLYAIEANTGQLKWKYSTGGAIHATPAIYKNTVYFGSYDGNYYAVNTATGKTVWKFRTKGEKKVGAMGLWTMQPKDKYMEDPYDFYLSSPVIDSQDKDPLIYFGSSDGNVYALNAVCGDLIWKFSTQGIIHSSAALANGIVYIGSWDTYMYALDARNGQLKWKFKTGDQPVYHLMEGVQGSPTYYEGMIYFGARDGYFYGLDAITGGLIWKYSANGSWIITTAAAKDGVIYFGTSDTYLFVAADARTGKELYHFKANGYVYSSPAIAGNSAYFGDFTGKMYALDLSDSGRSRDVFLTPGRKRNGGKVLNAKEELDFDYIAAGDSSVYYSTSIKVMNILYTLGAIVSSPVIGDDVIYFGSADGSLYAVKLK
jgi:eukaryotic-like serine/threonine-protein kinase